MHCEIERKPLVITCVFSNHDAEYQTGICGNYPEKRKVLIQKELSKSDRIRFLQVKNPETGFKLAT